MKTYLYENLTLERLESAMNDIFSTSRIASRKRSKEQYWHTVNLAYPQTTDELFKQKLIEKMSENKLDVQITETSNSYGNSRIYRYLIGGDSALRFEQIPYPECCGIAIIKNFSCNRYLSKSDFIEAITKFIEDLVANDRFSKVLFYTTRGSNGDRHFQQFDGITILDSFQNRRSGNMLVGFEIDLVKFQKSKAISKWERYSEDDDFDESTEGDDAFASDLDIEIQLADQRLAESRARLNSERREAIEAASRQLRATQSAVAGQYGLYTGENLANRPLNTGDRIWTQIERILPLE